MCRIWGGAGSWASRMGKVGLETVIPDTGTPSVRGEGHREVSWVSGETSPGTGGSGQAYFSRERGARAIVIGLEYMGCLEKGFLDLGYKKQSGGQGVGNQEVEAGTPSGCRGE